jgi:hypothetical protein
MDLKKIDDAYNGIKHDRYLVIIFRILASIIIFAVAVCFATHFIDRAHNRKSILFWGMMEYHPVDSSQIQKAKSDNGLLDNANASQQSTKGQIGKFVEKEKSVQISPAPIVSKSSKEDSLVVNKTEINNNTGANFGNIGGNGNNVTNNFGIQRRVITKEFLQPYLSYLDNKAMRIGFVAPVQDGEILNVKRQIITMLKAQGYTNIEEHDGIRLFIGADMPDDIVLINNELGGKTFYISAAK